MIECYQSAELVSADLIHCDFITLNIDCKQMGVGETPPGGAMCMRYIESSPQAEGLQL